MHAIHTSSSQADLSIDCRSATHRVYQTYAVVMMLVYPLGVPAVLGLLFYRNRNAT